MSDMSWHLALSEFIRADTPDGWGRIVEAHRGELLDPLSLLTFERAVTNARRENSPNAGTIEAVSVFLHTAQRQGVQAAVSDERQRRERIVNATARFLSAPLAQTGQTLRQHEQTLLSADAVRMAKRMIGSLASEDDLSDPLTPLRRRVRELQVEFLEHARAQGIDIAERQYADEVGDVFGRFGNAYAGDND